MGEQEQERLNALKARLSREANPKKILELKRQIALAEASVRVINRMQQDL
jgi:hypothetical protein